MTKFLTAAALATLAFAGSAQAEQVRIPTAGKSFEQIHIEVVDAAHTVCKAQIEGEPLLISLYTSCVRNSVKAAIGASGNSSLIAYSRNQPIRMASR